MFSLLLLFPTGTCVSDFMFESGVLWRDMKTCICLDIVRQRLVFKHYQVGLQNSRLIELWHYVFLNVLPCNKMRLCIILLLLSRRPRLQTETEMTCTLQPVSFSFKQQNLQYGKESDKDTSETQ